MSAWSRSCADIHNADGLARRDSKPSDSEEPGPPAGREHKFTFKFKFTFSVARTGVIRTGYRASGVFTSMLARASVGR